MFVQRRRTADRIFRGALFFNAALTLFWGVKLATGGNAYFFGAYSGIPFAFQARGILSGIPPELFQALPYLMTIGSISK